MAGKLDVKSALIKLKSSKSDVNIAAIQKLEEIGSSDPTAVKPAIPSLIELLKKSETEVKIAALNMLGDLGGQEPNIVKFAVPQMAKIVMEGEEDEVEAALDALTAISGAKPGILYRVVAKIIRKPPDQPGMRDKLIGLVGATYGDSPIGGSLSQLSSAIQSSWEEDGKNAKKISRALQKGKYEELEELLSEVGPGVEADVQEEPELKAETEPVAQDTGTELEAEEEEPEEEEDLEEDMEMDMDMTEKSISEGAFDKMAEMLLEKAREAYEDGDYEAVEKYTEKIEELAQKSKEGIYVKEVESLISSAETAIEWAKNIGGETSKAVTMLKKAKNSFDGEYYEAAMNYAKQAMDLAEMAKSSVRKDSPRVESSAVEQSGLSKSFAQTQKLDQDFTFDRFVVGNSNRFAHAAAVAVAEKPAQTYNPLFIYSGVGLGKTHLLQAIGNYIRDKMSHLKVLYVTTEKFTHDLMEAMEAGAMSVFRKKYREVDLLLVDDVQFLSGQESTQEEFYNTFNTLYGSKRQIVLTSDRPPTEIGKLEKRILTRFEAGLITDISEPDLEMRMVILKKMAAEEHASVPEDVIAYISKQIKTNIRSLKGALKQTLAFSTLTDRGINIDVAKEVLKSMGEEEGGKSKKPRDRLAATEGEKEEEEEVIEMQPLEFEGGHSYLIEEERPKYVFEVLNSKLNEGCEGMIVTRTNPKQLQQKYGLKGANLYWLTDRRVEGAETIRPSLERMITSLENFMEGEKKAILALDGVEYLISLSRFDPVLKFIRELVDVNSLTNTIFIVPINPMAISKQELSMFERELETVRID